MIQNFSFYTHIRTYVATYVYIVAMSWIKNIFNYHHVIICTYFLTLKIYSYVRPAPLMPAEF